MEHQERAAILAYCEEDVLALERLLPAMLPEVTSSLQRLGWALLRGRYMAAVARMEWNGVPIDVQTLRRLRANWRAIADGLIEEVDRDFGVYEGRSFRSEQFEVPRRPRNPLAAPRERRASLRRRHVPPAGQGLSGDRSAYVSSGTAYPSCG